jgi:FAD/FMN-containing dehydrogenase
LIGGVVVATLGRPSLHLGLTAFRDPRARPTPPPGFVDDASGLNQTRAEIWNIPSDPAAAERQLVALVHRARAEGLPIAISGARHSMGGHSIRRDGIVVNMLPFDDMSLDEARDVLHVHAGALWSKVLPYLNERGRSVAVMQSNNSFSVGGSISVNCHGWQANHPPISSTVESFRILRADGSVVRCSRSENAELFSLALGGYGLFGVILDVELRVVPNEEYRLERFVIPTDQYVATFEKHVRQSATARMAYGRLSVPPRNFLVEAILNVFHRIPSGDGKPSRVDSPEVTRLTRAMFRGQAGSDYGKALRWQPRSSSQERFHRAPSSATSFLASQSRSSRTAPPIARTFFTSTSCRRTSLRRSSASCGRSFLGTRATCSTSP